MEFWLQKDDTDKFTLPVKPSQYTVSVTQKNTIANVVKLGDINLIGKTGLREISLSSFFPARDYNFSYNADRKDPKEYIEKLDNWRASGEIIRVIITGALNMECTIESFSWGEQDATGDIYFSALLREYRRIKVRSLKDEAETTNSGRATQSENTNSGTLYTVQKGDSLWKIAKKMYGKGSEWRKIYEANTDKISNPDKIYVGQQFMIP